MEITVCGAESSCACARVVLFPLQSCPLSPRAAHQHCRLCEQWVTRTSGAFHLLAFGSLVIPAPCAGHRHCWQLLSEAGPAVLAVAVTFFPQGLKVLPGKSSGCAIAVSHTQRHITYPRGEIGWYSLSILVRVLNTGESSTCRVCGFW